MKKKLILALGITLSLFSCKFDDEEVTYGTTSVYIVNQDYNRNLVVGEGLELKVGVALGGLMSNNETRSVNYVVAPELVTATTQVVMPESYYTLGDKQAIFIPEGELKGYLSVKLDSAAFLADPKALTGEYILPVRLTTSGNIEKVNDEKNYIRVSVSYFAKQHGNYQYHGTTTSSDGSSVHYENKAIETNSFRLLKTAGPRTLQMVADPTGDTDPAKNTFSLNVEVATHGGGEVTITPVSGAAIQVEPAGTSTYDEKSKTFYLNYRYDNNGLTHTAADTLVFRNRIRDVQDNGLYLNEWRGF